MAIKTSDIKLGDVAKDTITGFKGVVVGITTYINGCLRMSLQDPKLDKEGKPLEWQTFDSEQLKLVKRAKPRATEPSGGPRPNVARRPDVRR